MAFIYCPFLSDTVELTDERERHIAEAHPDLFPDHRDCIDEALSSPDLVRRSARVANARLFSRWFATVHGGKHVVVVVVSGAGAPRRHWVITAYIARHGSEKDLLWKRN